MSNDLSSKELVTRLRDPKFTGQEMMREEAARAIEHWRGEFEVIQALFGGDNWRELTASQIHDRVSDLMLQLTQLQIKIKRYEPTDTYNGLTIEQWKTRAETAEARLAHEPRVVVVHETDDGPCECGNPARGTCNSANCRYVAEFHAALRAAQPPPDVPKFAVNDRVRIIRGTAIREVKEVLARRYVVTLSEEEGVVVLGEEQLELVERPTPTKSEGPRGKPCTCDTSCGGSIPCYVESGGKLGELWYCQKRAATETRNALQVPTAPPGTKVIYLDENGYRDDCPAYRALGLVKGGIYTLDKTSMGQSYTSIWLREFPHRSFNSVCFAIATTVSEEAAR